MVKIDKRGNSYHFLFENEQVTIEVSQLHQGRDNYLRGEVLIKSLELGYQRHLHQAQFSFSSTRARKELVKTLDDLFQADWKSIIERLCLDVLRLFREGEPVVELIPGEATPPKFVLPPLLIQNYPTILFGDPSAGKSLFAILLAITIILPWADNPIFFEAPEASHHVLYLDYETDRETVSWQLKRILQGMNLPSVSLLYRRCFLPLSKDCEAIRAKVASNAIDTIIIDSLGLACGGELKDAQPAIEFFTALRSLNVTSLILAHTAKSPENPKKRSIYGSVFFEAQSRNVWELVKVQEASEENVDIALYHRKPPPFGKLSLPLGYKLSFTDTEIKVDYCDPRTTTEFLERMSTQVRILESLKSGALSAKGIAEQLGLARNTCDQALKRLKDKGKIVKMGDKWGLVAQKELLETGSF